jgi:hypothetical protein
MAIDKVDGGSADRMRREMESRQNDMLEEQQRELLAVDSAAQAAQEVAAAGNVGDGSEIAKAGEAGGVSTENQMEMNQEDPGLAANASDQQDRGENWKAFASNQDDSLSRAAAEKDINNQLADDNGDEKAEEAKKIQVADLLKEMTLQSGRIKS